LLATGAIGQAAHGVDRFEGWARSDQGVAAGQRAGQQPGLAVMAEDGVQNGSRLGHAARAIFAAGHFPVIRADHRIAGLGKAQQGRQIGLHRRV